MCLEQHDAESIPVFWGALSL